MGRITSIIGIVFLVTLKSFGQSEKCNIQGTWLTYNKKMKVEFYQTDNIYNVKVVWNRIKN